jgi:hypothetical protein
MSITVRSPRVINFAVNATDPMVGPGSYDILPAIVPQTDSPIPFQATAARFREEVNPNPGPADYNPKTPSLSVHGSGTGMRSITPRQSWQIIESPDPCNYQHIKNWERSKNGGQLRPREPMSSRSPRALEPRAFSKATCADYNLRPDYEKGTTIGQGSRGPLFKVTDNPGPADYQFELRAPRWKRLPTHEFLANGDRELWPNAKSLAESCGLSHDGWGLPKGFAPFGSKAKHKSIWGIKKTPGPGQYKIDSGKRAKKSSAPFGARGSREWISSNDNPGPGAYRPDSSRRVISDETKPFGGRAPRFEQYGLDNPLGPGQYEAGVGEVVAHLKLKDLPSPQFKHSSERSPFQWGPSTPGPGKYSPEIGARQAASHKLKTCIDGTTREKPGTFVGQYLNDGPGPATYSPEGGLTRKPGDPGGYWPHSPRSTFVRNTCAPSPERYSVTPDMVKPSYNVTYNVCKLS